MKIFDFKAKWEALSTKKTLSGAEAIKAVESDGYALQYVKEQTEPICLKAVERNGDALQYVEERFFIAAKIEMTIADIEAKLGFSIKIEK